jgi:23S rRNA (adenine2503-C2)-methyltransferase
MNPVPDSALGPPDDAAVERFQARLKSRGLPCFVRTQRGDAIAAACGQLALHGEARKVKVRLPAVNES